MLLAAKTSNFFSHIYLSLHYAQLLFCFLPTSRVEFCTVQKWKFPVTKSCRFKDSDVHLHIPHVAAIWSGGPCLRHCKPCHFLAFLCSLSSTRATVRIWFYYYCGTFRFTLCLAGPLTNLFIPIPFYTTRLLTRRI